MAEHRDGDVEQIADPDQPEPVDQSNMGETEQTEPQEQLDPLSEAPAHAGMAALPLLDELNEAIAQFPDAPANYVLRGELLLAEGRSDLAGEDFRTALQLADPLAETSNWGYINEALADRAREGLRSCE